VREGLWNFRKGDDLNALWLQKHSFELSFCINLGVHYDERPIVQRPRRSQSVMNDLWTAPHAAATELRPPRA
jgi:hypothetical protein